MSEQFIIKKTTPNDVLFFISPINNSAVKRKIHLTKRVPQVALPKEWALGVFFDPEVYNMYRKGLFTFLDNDLAVKSAAEAGVYFDDKLDFKPASPKDVENIKEILLKGNRTAIENAIKVYTRDKVKEVAINIAGELTGNVTKLLEEMLNIQLTMNID